MAKKVTVTRHRSAKTGEYVTKRFADRHPSITVKEKRRK
jgi:hypothetical protein